MSISGTTSAIPDAQADLHAHIQLIAEAIRTMVFDNLHYHLSPAVVNLMKDFLNTVSLNYIIDTKRKDHSIKSEHIQSLVRYGEVAEKDINKQRLTTDDPIANSYAHEPLSTLVLTLKYFHQYLKSKMAERRNPTFQNCFTSEFHLFANLVAASLVANKVVYDEIKVYTCDIDTTLNILYSNVLRLLERLFMRPDLKQDKSWSCNVANALKLLKLVRKYESLNPDEITFFAEIDRLMPAAGKDKFRDLYQQLQILALFKSSEQLCKDRDLFYSDSESDSSSDSDDDNRTPISADRDISQFEEEITQTDFALYENQFLKSLDFNTHYTFTLHQACNLLSNVKKYVSAAAGGSFYAGFYLILDAFGNAQQNASQDFEFAITRPSQRQMTCLFERFKAMSINTLKTAQSHDETTARSMLRKVSY